MHSRITFYWLCVHLRITSHAQCYISFVTMCALTDHFARAMSHHICDSVRICGSLFCDSVCTYRSFRMRNTASCLWLYVHLRITSHAQCVLTLSSDILCLFTFSRFNQHSRITFLWHIMCVNIFVWHIMRVQPFTIQPTFTDHFSMTYYAC